VAVSALLLLAVALFAVQTPPATLLGTVRDGATGAPIPGAVVSLTDAQRAVLTDELGRYALPDVPAGPQHLSVRAESYVERTLHALVPRDGELVVDVSLRPDPIRLEALVIRPPLALRGVEVDDSLAPADRSITVAALRNHPLLAEPDFLQALGGGDVVLMPESPSGVHVRGGASDQTAYLLDGIPILSPYHAAGVFGAWNPDALSRVELSSTSPPSLFADALSGVVAGVTRQPGPILGAEGSIGTSQARATASGPLGAGGRGFLLSWRSGFPSVLSPGEEPSYLRGETGDLLGKLEGPALGGHLRLLAYESENEIDASAVAEGEAGSPPPRNSFEWQSRSLGASWERTGAAWGLRVQAWSAESQAGSVWRAEAGRSDMSSRRSDEGAVLLLELLSATEEVRSRPSPPAARTTFGVRGQRIRTFYTIEPGRAAILGSRSHSSTPLVAAFLEHRRSVGSVQAGAGATLARTTQDLRFAPRADLRWRSSERLTMSASYARLHQYAQSLRNPESVVGNIFPADLYVGAGEPDVPVAESDLGVVAADFRPTPGVRASVQAWARAFDGLLLVAPAEGQPFATGRFVIGTGSASGVAVDLSVAAARYGAVASYGWQRVRFAHEGGDYVPDHGASHLLEAGVIVFPSATWQARVGAAAALGRRSTAVAGGLEWEACNLLDEGCEFGGSPTHEGEPVGGQPLPAYMRVDVGARKHWHARIVGRDALLALFGTVTNVFARRNVLTYVTDPLTGEKTPVEMRPFSPLVLGVDWRF
jgi:hypothetical protein